MSSDWLWHSGIDTAGAAPQGHQRPGCFSKATTHYEQTAPHSVSRAKMPTQQPNKLTLSWYCRMHAVPFLKPSEQAVLHRSVVSFFAMPCERAKQNFIGKALRCCCSADHETIHLKTADADCITIAVVTQICNSNPWPCSLVALQCGPGVHNALQQ